MSFGGGMIDRLLDFLAGRAAPAVAKSTDELELAVAALLIEAARMDESFDAAERAAIERLLAQRFDWRRKRSMRSSPRRSGQFTIQPSIFRTPGRYVQT